MGAGPQAVPQVGAEARAAELKCSGDFDAFDVAGEGEALSVTGKKPISSRWKDINNSDEATKFVASRAATLTWKGSHMVLIILDA